MTTRASIAILWILAVLTSGLGVTLLLSGLNGARPGDFSDAIVDPAKKIAEAVGGLAVGCTGLILIGVALAATAIAFREPEPAAAPPAASSRPPDAGWARPAAG